MQLKIKLKKFVIFINVVVVGIPLAIYSENSE